VPLSCLAFLSLLVLLASDQRAAAAAVDDKSCQDNEKYNCSGDRPPVIFAAPWVGPPAVVARPTSRPDCAKHMDDSAERRYTTTTKSGSDSRIGSGMSIVGKIECNGPAQVFGRIEGELRASDLLVGDGATIDGSVIAQNVTVCGRIKGTIRAVRVKLQNSGAVEGDIFHRSLSIDENSQFEGSSRRVENPTEIPSSIDAKVPQTKDIQSPTPTSNIDADLQRVE